MGEFQTGGFPDLGLSFLFCPFRPFWDFPDFSGIFPICSGMVRWSGDFPDSSFFSVYYKSTYEEEKGSATQSGPFPKKVGNAPVWKPPQRTRPYQKYYDILIHYRRINTLSVAISCEFSPGKQGISETLP